jgi:hypothetical protein
MKVKAASCRTTDHPTPRFALLRSAILPTAAERYHSLDIAVEFREPFSYPSCR